MQNFIRSEKTSIARSPLFVNSRTRDPLEVFHKQLDVW